MKISLSQAGKRFNREWIFRNVTLDFSAESSYAITGPNGSGKSTLLQTLGGMLHPSEGTISFSGKNELIHTDKAFQNISFCAPYLEVIEEMTLVELLDFHQNFKPFLPGFTTDAVIEAVDLKQAAHKQIRYYSSGMKQRVKLALAIFTNTAVILLDEPCSNFDTKGIALYHSLIKNYGAHRLIIVSSNDEVEYGFCNIKIAITDYKPNR